MSVEFIETLQVRRFSEGCFSEVEEAAVRESRITIFINGRETVKLLCLPAQVEELTAGWLLSEGFIESREDITEMIFNPRPMTVEVRLAERCAGVPAEPIRSITSGCGRGITFISPLNASRFPPVASAVVIPPGRIIELMRSIQKQSPLFQKTGGVHTAVAASLTETLFSADDIGRHNAVDKVLGWMLQTGRSAESVPLLAVTGRLSSEIVTKVVRGRFPCLISPSAPTAGAVQLGQILGVTIIGFARGSRFTVYTHPERIAET